jgi:hypothetical protein
MPDVHSVTTQNTVFLIRPAPRIRSLIGKFYCVEKTFLGITPKGSKMPVINRKQFLRSLINNKKSRLLAVTKLSKQECAASIKLSRFLETMIVQRVCLLIMEMVRSRKWQSSVV